MKQTLRRYGQLIEPGARRRWVLLILLATLVSVLEAVSALLVFFIMATVTKPDRSLVVPGLGDLHHRYPTMSDGSLFTWIAIVLTGFFLLRAALVLTQSYIQYRVINTTGALLSTRLLRGYLQAPYSWHLDRNSMESTRNAYDSVLQIVANVFVPAVGLASESLIVIAIIVVLMVKAFAATILAIVLLGPIIFGLMRVLQPHMVSAGETNEVMAQRSLQTLQQSLHGIRDIKILGREEYFTDQLAQARGTQARALGLRSTLYDVPRAIVETLAIVFILGFVTVMRIRAAPTQESLAILGLFAYAVLRVMPALHRMVTFTNLLKFGAPAVTNVVDDLTAQQAWAEQETARAPTERFVMEREIVVSDVSYRYGGSDVDVLERVNLRIGAGESIGIVGPTGGGKTTLVDVLLGLLVPSSGQVAVDGLDISTRVAAWQAQLGVVPQSPFLLDDTLRRNIALGLADHEIDEGDVAAAIRLAQLEEFVASLPIGLDTMVGERGIRISGGQRQRVAIARALYRRPNVLVFDEGTSALDSVTEGELIAALENLRGEHTLITIAHRLTTVRNCDRIVLLRHGRIVDVGSYDDLLERSAEFRQLAR